MTAHADDAPADPVDPWQEGGRQNNDAAREYWDKRNAASGAGEPVPDLPADQHNTRVLEKLAADQDAARDLGKK